MKLFISFFLSLFIYIFLILLFIYFIISTNKTEKIEQVYIHQAIFKDNKKQNIAKITKPKQVEKEKVIKQEVKKEPIKKVKKEVKLPKKPIKKTEDTFAKGGDDIKFDDIFANTSDKIPTKKIKQKKQENMTKKRGHTEEFTKMVKKIKSKLQSSIIINSNSDKKSSTYISNEFEKVWAQINTEDGNFVTLRVDVTNGVLNIVVISTNLDTIVLNKFLNKLQNIDTSKIKNFHGKITFNTKLKGD